jgi:16S rRNA (uracil1498-N3)-methyltransferase
MPRFFVDTPLGDARALELPPAAARHVQVLRLQPGQPLTLFDGRGGEWSARVTAMGRQSVAVELLAHDPVERELPLRVTLVAAMPANDRFDWLVEKATELGVSAIVPVLTARSVLKLAGERAQRKLAHWQGVAAAAAEQCGRTRVPTLSDIQSLQGWVRDGGPATLADADAGAMAQLLLCLQDAAPIAQRLAQQPRVRHWVLYSGPEGGFTSAEELELRGIGALPTSLGPRVLRAETAPLAALALIAGGA